MFKLESNRLKREFKIANSNFFASQILNKYSNMSFVPDGNGCEFVIRLEDGNEFSSKGLLVKESFEENNRLKFVFEECCGVRVTLEYWVHGDQNTLCKQLILDQSDNSAIDYVILENIGIINSKTHFSVDTMEDGEIKGVYASLGQPFYIDSLFFGCEFPATDNRIIHGAGQIKYYIGKCVGKNYRCPVTIIGGAEDNSSIGVQKAFFEYIDFISLPSDLRFQYNSWYDGMLKIDEDKVRNAFSQISKGLAFYNAPKLDAYVVDDGWNDYTGKFWGFNKRFPNGLTNISADCRKMGSSLGLWLGPRGGYNDVYKFAKKIQRGKNGFANKNAKEICIASQTYVNKLTEFLIDTVTENDITYLKLDGFCHDVCTDSSHDHITGGENEMYFVTEMWQRWIKLFEAVRHARACDRRPLWINMTCYVNVSPWWLQWVNSIWLQNSSDIGFADNIEDQPQVEAEITYRDARYFDIICKRANQIPLKNIYNHEPIYGSSANVNYTDEEFDKYINWCTVRGPALNEIHLSYELMSDGKWASLAKAMRFQKENYYILKNATFIGGNPEENNVYGYISWADNGDGIIALRNPTDESAPLTLNINKLMGAPLHLKNAKPVSVYNNSVAIGEQLVSYGSKLNLTLHPYEVLILKIVNEEV